MKRLALALRWSSGILVVLAACGTDSKTGPETGSVHVVVATIGAELDPDGYTVLVDGTARGHVASQADSTLSGLPAGSVSVNLGGVATNCHATTPLPIAVNVSADQTVDASVTISCVATSGFLRLTLGGPTGQDQDADGYLYSIDGGASTVVDIPGVVVPVATGDHRVVISGLAANCEIAPSPPELDFYVGPADTTEVQFAVGCSYITGAIKVSAATTGPRLDPDGYNVRIDGGAPFAIGINGSHTFTGLAPGTYDVEISGIAPNCILFAPTVVQATIGADSWTDPLTVTFPVQCPEVGTLRVITPVVPQPNAFAIFLGNDAYPLGASDTTLIPNVPVGSHAFSVRIPDSGCPATPNNGNFTITANGFTDLAIAVDCPQPPE